MGTSETDGNRILETFGVPWPDLNEGISYTDVVKSPSTLIEFYSSKYPDSAPLRGWLQRIQSRQISVDGEVTTDPEMFLRAGSKLLYRRLPWREPDAPFVLHILFEDEDLVAVNKPSGLQVLPGGLFQQKTVLTQLQWRTQGKLSSLRHCEKTTLQEINPVPVHRLGRGTSGVLLCAKSKTAKVHLAAYFADGTSMIGNTKVNHDRIRKISKTYRALVIGIIKTDEVIINQPIGIMQYPGVAKGLYIASSEGKPALSKILVIKRNIKMNYTLIQVEIQSGRPHQIRIHLSFIGHPLLGDPLYLDRGKPQFSHFEPTNGNFAVDGGYNRPIKPVPGDCGYHLHAHKLEFYHPVTNKVIKIEAPLPPMLQTDEELRVV